MSEDRELGNFKAAYDAVQARFIKALGDERRALEKAKTLEDENFRLNELVAPLNAQIEALSDKLRTSEKESVRLANVVSKFEIENQERAKAERELNEFVKSAE